MGRECASPRLSLRVLGALNVAVPMPMGPEPYVVTIEEKHAHLGLTAGAEVVFNVSDEVPGLGAPFKPGELVAIWHLAGGFRLDRIAEAVQCGRGIPMLTLGDWPGGRGRTALFYKGLRRIDRAA